MNEIFLLIGEWTEEDGHATSMPDTGFRLCRSVTNIPGLDPPGGQLNRWAMADRMLIRRQS